ncbi:MAG: hypothetical protein AAFZ07_19535 [Actinomycetota bacterium]
MTTRLKAELELDTRDATKAGEKVGDELDEILEIFQEGVQDALRELGQDVDVELRVRTQAADTAIRGLSSTASVDAVADTAAAQAALEGIDDETVEVLGEPDVAAAAAAFDGIEDQSVNVVAIPDVSAVTRALDGIPDQSVTVRAQSEGLDQVADDLDAVGGNATGAAGALAFLTRGAQAAIAAIALSEVTQTIGSTIEASSDLEETISKVNQIFDDPDLVIAWGEESARAVGLPVAAALDFASVLTGLAKGLGVTDDDAAALGLTVDELGPAFVGVAADVASFFNASPEEAFERITAGALGSVDALSRYGVALTAPELARGAEALGLDPDNLTESEKVIVRLGLTLESLRNQNALGDFQRTSEGLANELRIAQAQSTDLAASIGSLLLPAATAVAQATNDFVLPALQRYVSFLDNTYFPAVGRIASALGDELAPVASAAWSWIDDTALPALGSLRNFITNTVIPAVDGFLQSTEFQTFLNGVGQVTDSITGGLGTAIGFIENTAIPAVVEFLATFGPQALTGIRTFVENFAAEAGQLGQRIIAVAGPAVSEAFDFVTGDLIPAAGRFGSEASAAVAESFQQLRTDVGPILSDFASSVASGLGEVPGVLGAVADGAGELADVFGDVLDEILPPIQRIAGVIVDELGEAAGEIFPELIELGEDLFDTFGPPLRDLAQVVGVLLVAAVKLLIEAWEAFGDEVVAAVVLAVQTISGVLQGVVTTVTSAVQLILAVLRGDWLTVWNEAGQIVSSVFGVITTVIGAGVQTIQIAFSTLLSAVEAIGSALWDPISDATSAAWDTITSVVSGAVNGVVSTISTAISGVRGTWDAVWGGVRDFFSEVWGEISGAVEGPISAIEDTLNGIVGFIEELPEKITSAAEGMWDGISDAFQDVIDFLRRAWNGVADFLNGISIDIPSVSVPGLGEVFGGASIGLDVPTFDLAGGGVFDRETTGLFRLAETAAARPEIVAPQRLIRQTIDDALAANGTGGVNIGPGAVVIQFDRAVPAQDAAVAGRAAADAFVDETIARLRASRTAA